LAEQAAIVHCQVDWLCSTNSLFRTQLESFAYLNAAKRGKARRVGSRRKKRKSPRKPTQGDPLKDFGEFLRKIDEVRQLSKMLLG